MKRDIVESIRAQRDRSQILAYLEQYSPRAANRLELEFDERIDPLAFPPLSARSGIGFKLVCEVLWSARGIWFFSISDDEITLVRIIDGRRDLEAAFYEDD